MGKISGVATKLCFPTTVTAYALSRRSTNSRYFITSDYVLVMYCKSQCSSPVALFVRVIDVSDGTLEETFFFEQSVGSKFDIGFKQESRCKVCFIW